MDASRTKLHIITDQVTHMTSMAGFGYSSLPCRISKYLFVLRIRASETFAASSIMQTGDSDHTHTSPQSMGVISRDLNKTCFAH